MPKLLYTSDLHGNKELYIKLLKKGEEENCNAIIIGGDLCPRTNGTLQQNIEYQKLFLEKFLIPSFKGFKQKNKGKEIYLIMGNDDFRINMDVLENADKDGILKSIHNKALKINRNLSIVGYSFINTTPFSLKDWEKPDFESEKPPKQLLPAEARTVKKEEGTIEDDFKEIKKLSNPKKTIYVIHAPPHNTNLDIIAKGQHVGSRAIRKFIEEEQPLLTLHGHIHESPKMSGTWKDKIKIAICINVGSSYPENKLNCAIIDTEKLLGIMYLEA